MAEKLYYIEELAEHTLNDLNKRENWVNYLVSSSYHYKYSFHESCLIFAQRPDATAVASYDQWNNKMHRFINKGTQGIALLDASGSNKRLKYVFDISDTNGQRMPYIWQLKDEHIERVNSELVENYNIENQTDQLEETIPQIIDKVIEDNIEEINEDFMSVDVLAGNDNLEDIVRDTLRDSILVTVLTRCGYKIDENSYKFSQLHFFNSFESIVQLGVVTSEYSETILREIEISVKTIEKEIRNERSKDNAATIQSTERAHDTRRNGQGTVGETVGQIRQVEEEVSAGQSQRDISNNAADGDAVSALSGSGEGSKGTDGDTDTKDEEEHSTEPMGTIHNGDREPVNQGNDFDEIDEQKDIDIVLLRGGSFEGGKQRIINFYFDEQSNSERAKFLKKEYGIGGGTVYFTKERSGFEDHNAKGITIHNRGYGEESINLSWPQAAKRIGELIECERYFEQKYPNDKPLIKPAKADNIETKGADDAPFSMPEELAEKASSKRKTQQEINFTRIEELVPHIMDKRYRYACLKSDGYTDLSFEWVGNDRLIMAHYSEHNGDLMADPDMELIVDFENKTVMPATYQNDYLGVFQNVYMDENQWQPKLSKQLTSFLNTWLKNVGYQGHVLAEAVYFDDDRATQPIIFDAKGKEFGFDIPHDMVSSAKLAELQNDSTETKIEVVDDSNINEHEDQQTMEEHSYKWEGMLRIEDEEAMRLFDKGYDVFLLHEDNTTVLAESEKRLIQHINSGGLVGIEKEDFYLIEEAQTEQGVQTEKINYQIEDDNLGIGGAKEKFQRNVTAIMLLKEIEDENRTATAKEQGILSQYVGWGGLAKAFDENDSSWSNEYVALKELLDESEYSQARASTLNSYYTSPVVIKAMYQAIENMGFTGGNILEPSMGVGNFFGMLPESINNSKLYGVELDSISGRMAKQLYQNADIQVMGFEHTAHPDNFFDIAIGNVPFGAYTIPDIRYDKYNLNVHDYFFAKSLDKVRPGGVIAFITSKGTLDKKNSSFRKYMAQRAELIGAIRLPNTAFKANAGTEVTSDIIFLQKRDSILDVEPDWVQLGNTPDGITVNQYFADIPQMILGTMKQQIGMYGSDETTCVPIEGISLEEQLNTAITNIHTEIEESEYMVDEPDIEDTSIPADPNVKNFSYCIVDEEVYYRENSRMNLVNTNATAISRIKGMIVLRKTLNSLISAQIDGMSEINIKQMQRRLNDGYDKFFAEFGRINSKANSMAMNEDSSYYLLCSLELYDDENEFVRKADIFTKQTIRPYREITHVDTASEALAVSLARKGKIDICYISSLVDKEPTEVIEDLKSVIYKNPMANHDNIFEGWQTADEYLSGDVRDKLKTAKMIAKNNTDFVHHIQALEQVQPKDLEASDIDVKLGTVWISPEYIEQFVHETLNTPRYYRYDIKVSFSPHSGSWYISRKSADYDNVNANQRFGTQRMNAYLIIEETLNQKSIRITDRIELPDGTVKYELNKKETLLATQKQNLIQDEFKDWIYKDETRRNHLVNIYNENYNNIRPREYDGSHLEFFGMNPEIELRPHQKNAVARQLYGGNTLLAHVVGAGKTFTMIAAAMESKRIGLSNKSLFTVPNHLTEQTATEILTLYPSAKVLVATKKDFQIKNRKKFCSRIATGDYDIVVMGHSQFEKVPLSRERLIRMLNQQLDELTYAIEEQSGRTGMNYNVKQMERTKKSIQARLEKLNNQSRKDDVIDFEELGVDRLFVDESQYYKNLYVITKMRNVAGVQQTEAQKSADMFMKCQYLDELTGGRGITFASGTPISNSMTEMFTVQRYLQMHELRKRGLHHFDCWASVFGETETAYELAPEGNKFRAKKRFAKFYNLPELISVFKNVADIQTNDMLDLPIPKLKSGKHINISVPASDIQRKMIGELGDLADKVRNGEVDPTEANMLTITNEGRKIALDQRMINPLLPDEENSKINTAMRKIYDIWERTKEEKLTQLVFCDLSTPKKNGEFNIYDDLKKKWIEKGIPEKEVAFIHDAKNEKQKAQLFAKVRSGEVRILIGSTQMMGAGTNVQTKLKAIHHLDCPWRPSDLEQRDGRILRQGNNNEEVEIYRYVTEETFDSYSYQLVEQKQKFIGQIMTSKAPVRSAADLDEAALSYAEVKALATGNPLIKERMELEVEVSRLKLLKSEYRNQKYRYETQISTTIPNKIANIKQRITGMKKDIETVSKYEGDEFSIKIRDKIYTEKRDAGALIISCVKDYKDLEMHEIGEYKGFKLYVQNSAFYQSSQIVLQGAISHGMDMGTDAIGNIQRIDNMIKNTPESLNHSMEELHSAEEQLKDAKNELEKPFEHEFELKQKKSRLTKITHELEMDKKDENIEIDEDDSKDEQPVVKSEIAR